MEIEFTPCARPKTLMLKLFPSAIGEQSSFMPLQLACKIFTIIMRAAWIYVWLGEEGVPDFRGQRAAPFDTVELAIANRDLLQRHGSHLH
jgi:hypothetical protein